MTDADLNVLRHLAPHINGLGSVGVCSPLREFEGRLFPKATRLPRWRWDLNNPSRRRFDVLVAANVFMYSPDPERWFANVLASCRWFVMIDLVRRRRGPDHELGTDQDRMRYVLGDEQPRVTERFDLARLGNRLLASATYPGGANPFDSSPRHVLALFRGDLGEPVLRVDDYPTGVRPILDDLSPLHAVLSRIESSGLRYHLGIVPALVSDEMATFLTGLENMVPVAHGYDHAYPKYAPILIEADDPFNRGTVGVFNEFRGVTEREIVGRLVRARERLAELLDRDVDRYIPPCNRADRRTGRALVEAGFRSYLSERRIPGCPLPWLRSDFYGLSTEFDTRRDYDIVTLHATWEMDVANEVGHMEALDRLLDSMVARREALRARVAPLRHAVNDVEEIPVS